MKRTSAVVAGLVAFAVVASLAPLPVRADEGMWTFDNPPTKLLKERYGFTPTAEWLEHVRLSSVRFNDGGSGSFVSKTGLVMTNHHVGLGCIQKISTQEKDHVKEGYLARTAAEEVPCPDLELNVLQSMEDVTKRVLSSVPKGASDKEAAAKLKAVNATIEKECADATKLRCDVVSFYQGSEYQLYRYRKYTDVRLVFAPEQSLAFYGGDPDNFTYPRYDLDVALFRAYESGKAVAPKHFLAWSANGPAENELVFVSGHPGSTARQQTLAQLEAARDHQTPFRLKSLRRRRDVLATYASSSPESARRAKAAIFGIENSLKAITGQEDGLLDPAVMKKKADEEASFRALVLKDPAISSTLGSPDPWKVIADAEARDNAQIRRRSAVGFGGSRLLGIAGQIVRLVVEKEKPNETRLEEYRESSLQSLELRLYSPAPIYDDMEKVTLADQWAEAKESLPADDPFLKAVLDGKAPAEVAAAAIAGTKLADPKVRRELVAGGRKAVEASTDPMIVLARRIDPLSREIRTVYEETIETPLKRAGEKLGKARFAVYGKSVAPDAGFTLRLSYGSTKGYPVGGTVAPWKTTFYGLYERSAAFDDKEPFKLPARWHEKRTALDVATPFNFVSTADIIGGNSGSPVINRNAEVVGLVFDMNMESLASRYVYTDAKARCVAVHSRALTEAIGKVFDAPALAAELMGR